MSSLSPTRDSPRAAELLRKARSQFTFTSEEKKTLKRAQQQHVLVDGYIEKQRREIVADCSCSDISSDHNIIFLLLILEKVLCAISLHISLHCSLVASRRRPNWFRYESYCSCWPETRNILILNVSIWPRTNDRTQEVCKYRLWYLKLVAGPFTIAVVLVGTMYPSTAERDPVLCCCSCTAAQNNITSINGHHSIYWYSIANVFRAFRPSSDKHFTCLCAPVSIGCCWAAKWESIWSTWPGGGGGAYKIRPKSVSRGHTHNIQKWNEIAGLWCPPFDSFIHSWSPFTAINSPAKLLSLSQSVGCCGGCSADLIPAPDDRWPNEWNPSPQVTWFPLYCLPCELDLRT